MDFTTAFIKWLLKCDYIKENKLFLNALNADDNNIQLVTQQIVKSETANYVDGSQLLKVHFTIFDYKSIAFNQIVKTMVENHENVEDLLDVNKIIEYIIEQNEKQDFPILPSGYVVQNIEPEYYTPSTPSIDNFLARYSIPITCEVLKE